MSDCIFCKIAAKEIPARMVYEDEQVFAFEDIHPQAPVHILVCPRKHIASLGEAAADDAPLLGHILLTAGKLAAQRNITAGYRTLFNNGRGAGQSVFHLHLHLLGGRALHWPPG